MIVFSNTTPIIALSSIQSMEVVPFLPPFKNSLSHQKKHANVFFNGLVKNSFR